MVGRMLKGIEVRLGIDYLKNKFGGRLGEYKYYDMDAVIDSALKLARKEL